MKLTAAVRLLRLLHTRREDALTVKEIAQRWQEQTAAAIHIRSIQRYMSELSADSADGPALLDVVGDGKDMRYHLRLSQVAQWFMTEATALDLLLTRQVMLRSFGPFEPTQTRKLSEIAETLTADSMRNRRLHERLRIVPDGIGRLPAPIEPQALAASIDAVAAGQKLAFEYTKSDGRRSAQVRTPLGLVAKDGAIYLLATEGLSDPPRHFALHRMSNAQVVPQVAQARPDFDLDRYIQDSHQLSHKLDQEAPPISLRLRVSPLAIYHFTERRLSVDQHVGPESETDGWRVVTATVPETILLVPFLVSMGPWIEVVSPAAVRAETAKCLRESAALYAADAQG